MLKSTHDSIIQLYKKKTNNKERKRLNNFWSSKEQGKRGQQKDQSLWGLCLEKIHKSIEKF